MPEIDLTDIAARRRTAHGTMAARPVITALRIGLTVVFAVAVGIWSAHLAVQSGTGFGRVDIGAWRHYPRLGTFENDPYARAAILARNEWPLGLGEGQFFLASADDQGLPLHSRCDYLLSGVLPAARAWSLVAHRSDGRPLRTDIGAAALTSAMVLYRADNGVEVAISHGVQPGNWLPLPADTPFALAIRLYDPATGVTSAVQPLAAFPQISRQVCR